MFRENLGRVFIILAGAGCLVVLIFVMGPQLFEPAPSMTPGEIVEEVLGPERETAPAEAETEAVMPVPSPLVAVRDNGEELPVLFPAPEGGNPEAVETGETGGAASGLPAVLSAEDVAAAAAALEGLPAGEAVEPAGEPAATLPAAGGMEVPEAPAEPQAGIAAIADVERQAARGAAELKVVDRLAEAVEEMATQREAPEAFEPVGVDQAETAPEPVMTDGAGGPPIVEGPVVRKGEFDARVRSDVSSRAPLEPRVPSGEAPGPSVPEARQAGEPESGLPPRTAEIETTGVVVPGTLRGIMGYRLPLVSRQEVPDQIVSGVLIPAHTTFVILKGGSWELVDVSQEELNLLREAAARRETGAAAMPEPEAAAKGWSLLRMFRKQEPAADE